MTSSFWGLKLEGNLQYSKACVSDPFRVTAASLDTDSVSDDTIVSVCFKGEDEQEFIVANLSLSHNILQVPLNLRFVPGDKISFYLRGLDGEAGCVYLSGFNVVQSFEPLYVDSEEESMLEEENIPFVGAKRKRAVNENGATPCNGVKKSKRIKVGDKTTSVQESFTVSAKKENKTPKKLNKSISSDKDDSKKSDSPAKGIQSEKKNKKLKNKEISAFDITDLVSVEKEILSDESDEDFTMDGIEVDDDNDDEEQEDEEVSSGWEDDDDELDEEEDDDDEEEEEEDEDDDDDDDDEETPSPPKKKIEVTPSSAGRTPLTKKQKKQQDTPIPSKLKTPKSEAVKTSSQTPKSSKKNKENKENEMTPNQQDKLSKTPQPKSPKQIKAGGLVCEDLKVGTGNEAKPGKMVGVYYVGKLKAGGKTFDKHFSGSPFKFRLGAREVIQAWDMGLQGMKIGGKRRLTCPPAMAYGKKGMVPEIPPNSVLVFDVELKSVN